MKAYLATAILLTNIYSQANEPVSTANFIEAKVNSFTYKKALDPKDIAGSFIFDNVKMARSNMIFNINNKDNNFDSKLIYNKGILNFDSPIMKLDFDMGVESGFKDVKELGIDSSLVILNPTFFSFNGENFRVKMYEMDTTLKNYAVFCTSSNPELDIATTTGLEEACLTELYIGKNKPDQRLDLNLITDYEDGDQMKFDAVLSDISISNAKDISAKVENSKMELSKYSVKTSQTDFSCAKNEDMKVLDTDKLKKDCENSINLTELDIVIKNKEEKTRFYIDMDNINVANERLSFKAKTLQIVDQVSSVTTSDLEVDCQKSNESTLYDLHSMIEQCVQNGEINISRLVSRDEKNLWWRYDDILNSDFDPTAHIGKKEKDAAAINISLKDGKFYIKANTYKKLLVFMPKFVVNMRGQVFQNKVKDQIILDIQHIEVPFGWFDIKWKGLLLKIAKKVLVGENVSFNGDQMIIQL